LSARLVNLVTQDGHEKEGLHDKTQNKRMEEHVGASKEVD
jgi:hypothetical protein